jgi:uncharacterized protein
MTAPTVTLQVVDAELAICRLPCDAPSPPVPASAALYSVTRTADELSIVCPVADAPPDATVEAAWRALRVEGSLDFALTGIMAALAQPLAAAGVPVFAVSTYDTDYVLVRHHDVEAAIDALRRAGHTVRVE